MGLLDDAIREHLELKRLRGADPGLVAREEHEALGSVDRGDGLQPEGQTSDLAGHGADLESPEPEAPKGASGQEPPHVGQETTELDMSTVLGEDGTQVAPGPREDLPASDHAEPTTAGDSLEWEVPGERITESSEQPNAPELAGSSGESIEDVLEETPDFLRETPEQERLWFEQRPPRDFDFDK